MTSPSSLGLPAPVAAYLAAEAALDFDALGRCFAADGWAGDEGRTHHGPDAIRAWQREAHEKYRYRVEPLAWDAAAGALHVRVRGAFPGSPVELDYVFRLAGDKIAALEIA